MKIKRQKFSEKALLGCSTVNSPDWRTALSAPPPPFAVVPASVSMPSSRWSCPPSPGPAECPRRWSSDCGNSRAVSAAACARKWKLKREYGKRSKMSWMKVPKPLGPEQIELLISCHFLVLNSKFADHCCPVQRRWPRVAVPSADWCPPATVAQLCLCSASGAGSGWSLWRDQRSVINGDWQRLKRKEGIDCRGGVKRGRCR